MAMVAGGEALRLNRFLLEHKLQTPRVLHRMARTAAQTAQTAETAGTAAAADAAAATQATPGRISERLLVDALAAATRALDRPSLPVEFGSTIRPADMGIFGMVILTAPNLGRALELSVQFQRLMTTTARTHLEHTQGVVRWVWRCNQPRSLGTRIRNEVVLTEHVAVVRALFAGALPCRVSFAHPAPCDSAAHARFFACPVAWGANEDSVAWRSAQLQSPLGADPALGAFIKSEAQRQLLLLPPSGSVDEVRDAILKHLPSSDFHLPTIAAVLGRAPRTLRRELATAGCAYRNIVDGVRKQRAVELASTHQHSMTEIALKLGFSEVSAFSRAWRRWFGQPFHSTAG
jgi:AraC-like DNA-binding protein